MPRPVIGLSTYREQAAWTVWNMPADLLPAVYTRSVEAAGAVVMLLPPQADGAADIVARLDGLIITGGPDVDPERYGQRPHRVRCGSGGTGTPGRSPCSTRRRRPACRRSASAAACS